MTELIFILLLILAGGVFAGAEIAIVALRKTRLQELGEEGRSGARAALALKEDPERFLATVQVGITVLGAAAAAFGGSSLAQRLTPLIARISWLAEHAHDVALGVVVAAVSYLSIVLGELVPKSLALRSAERYALWIGGPLLALSWLARPIVWLLSSSANLMLGPFGDSTNFTETRHSVEELQQIVEEATKAGTIHPEAGEIASRALEMPALRVSDVMVPRQQVIMIPKHASSGDLRPIFREHSHSRMPVYDGHIDNVVGYVSVKDLLTAAVEQRPIVLAAVIRPPYFVPESKQAVELLKEMRQRRMKFAIVVEEQGGIAGIVTLEDLVEELVGDIFSEHSQHVPELIKSEPGGSVIVSGAMPVREVNRALGFDLPEDGDWSTVAGLSMARAGRVPSMGEVFPLESGFVLEMVDVSPRRVRAVRIRPPASL
ncbi:MAG: hemolysin family protein [Deltaproteobacteria bacterium]